MTEPYTSNKTKVVAEIKEKGWIRKSSICVSGRRINAKISFTGNRTTKIDLIKPILNPHDIKKVVRELIISGITRQARLDRRFIVTKINISNSEDSKCSNIVILNYNSKITKVELNYIQKVSLTKNPLLDNRISVCHTENLYDCFLLSVGDKVIDRINGRYGIINTIRSVEVSGYPKTDLLEVLWEDGSISNPYANQLLKVNYQLNIDTNLGYNNKNPSRDGATNTESPGGVR